jgi:hypothetical protein
VGDNVLSGETDLTRRAIRAREWSRLHPCRHEARGELLPQGRAFSLLFTGRGCGRLVSRSDSGSGLRSSAQLLVVAEQAVIL